MIGENKVRHGFFTMWTPPGFASWIPQSGIRVAWKAVSVGRGDFAESSEVCDGGVEERRSVPLLFAPNESVP